MKTSRAILFCFLLASIFACKPEKEEVVINSPDLKLQLIFKLEHGNPSYRLMLNGKPVLLESALGIELKDIPSFSSGFVLLGKKINTSNSSWETTWGEVKYCS
jgi:hypothetical protein